MTPVTGNDRASAASEFADTARAAFAFLETVHGFQEESLITPENPDWVYATYEIVYRRLLANQSLRSVRLVFTPMRGELFLDCRYEDGCGSTQSVEIRDLLAMTTASKRLEFPFPVSITVGRFGLMQPLFEIVAEALQTHGKRFFDGDQTLWEELGRYRNDQLPK